MTKRTYHIRPSDPARMAELVDAIKANRRERLARDKDQHQKERARRAASRRERNDFARRNYPND